MTVALLVWWADGGWRGHIKSVGTDDLVWRKSDDGSSIVFDIYTNRLYRISIDYLPLGRNLVQHFGC